MSERMTDLERAYAFMEGHIACQRSICSFVTNCGCAAEIAEALAAARREGAEAARAENAVHIHIAYDNGVQNGKLAGAEGMRERAARTARNACLVPPDGGSPTEEERLVCEEAERRIRALPLTPAEP